MFLLKKLIRYFNAKRFLKLPAEESCIRENSDKKDIDIVTVAFNNDMVIKYQIALIKKYLKDDYYHTVVDNSNDNLAAEKIKKICLENDVGYIKLPKNNFTNSYSHGMALNWTYYNFILKRKLKYFGFLDHDIFPTKNTSLVDKIKKSHICYGLIEERKRKAKWYLWAGFCFFSFTDVCTKQLNFLGGKGLDTGGMNWFVLYKDIDRGKLLKVNHSYGKLSDGDVKQVDMYSIIDEWIHSFNASKWFAIDNVKERYKNNAIETLLKQYL